MKTPRSHNIKIPRVCTDQAGAFPRSSLVPETNNTNTVSIKLSEFPKYHIKHISHSRLQLCGSVHPYSVNPQVLTL